MLHRKSKSGDTRGGHTFASSRPVPVILGVSILKSGNKMGEKFLRQEPSTNNIPDVFRKPFIHACIELLESGSKFALSTLPDWLSPDWQRIEIRELVRK